MDLLSRCVFAWSGVFGFRPLTSDLWLLTSFQGRLLGLVVTAVLVGLLIAGCTGESPEGGWLGGPRLEVPEYHAPHDLNGNGIPSSLDMVAGARGEVEKGTRYNCAYFAGGYPPDGEGACTDIIWIALQHAGYDLKAALDADIVAHPGDYPRASPPDPNIDFRRVSNQVVFFEKYGTSLTIEVRPGEVENMVEWQAGDIVVFGPPYEHIGIVSDRRQPDGVPLVIHNGAPVASEDDALRRWPSEITHHFRFPPW